ncbi:MAG: hypothetical protein IKY16_07075 [Bacteroidales bacterium]|nr:hypothetical protein [Bacteroidales bacterium]
MKILVIIIMFVSVLAFGAVSAYLGYSILSVRCKIRNLYYLAKTNGKSGIAQGCGIFLLVLLILECILCLGTYPTL